MITVVLVVSLLLTAFGPGQSRVSQPIGGAGKLLPNSRPTPEVIALRSSLRLQLPVAQGRLTALGFHAAADGAVSLEPVGHQGNEGGVSRLFHKLFGGGGGGPTWYQLGGDGTPNAALDVGASPGTDVYSPVDGTVVAVTPYIVNGKQYGAEIDIQPQAAPSLVVALLHVAPDGAITVGTQVVSGVSRLGNVVDLSSVERQMLARFTQDAGNNVSIEARPAAVLPS